MAGPKILGQVLGTGTGNALTLYTSPTTVAGGKGSAVSSIVLINPTSGPLTFTVAAVPNGVTQSAVHTLIPSVAVSANDIISFQIGVSLAPGDFLRVAASNGAVAHAYGMEL